MHTTVYLLDDEPELLELLGDAVELTGLVSKRFTRANRFFEEVSEFSSQSILVLDLNMPEMDGIEVMRRLAVMDVSPSLILMSGHDISVLHSAEKLGYAHNLDIIATLSKPISLEQFQQLLREHESAFRNKAKTGTSDAKRALSVDELKWAIQTDQLVLHYQPQFEVASKMLVGVEALVRWQHPELGLIYPDRFISIAESSGLIGDLTHWVIDRAVRQGQQWQLEGARVAISVNISGGDITSLTLPEQLAALLENNRLDATLLTLEVTESALMGELVTSLDTLTRLRLKGFALSIDDFGTGYSSLSQLHRVPFTEMKIDQSFVSKMGEDKEACAIVRTCIILGHELDMKVVAEGVETEEQFQRLKSMGCDIAQGYLFSRPVPANEISPLIRARELKNR